MLAVLRVSGEGSSSGGKSNNFDAILGFGIPFLSFPLSIPSSKHSFVSCTHVPQNPHPSSFTESQCPC